MTGHEPLELVARDRVEPADWDRLAAELGGAPFHCFAWTRFSAQAHRTRPLYYLWRAASGQVRALAAGQEAVTRLGGGAAVRRLSFGSLPACGAAGIEARLLDQLLRHARTAGYAALSVNSFGTPLDLPMPSICALRSERRWEFLLDLGGTVEELWARLHGKKRNLIRKAQKGGVTATRVDRLEGLMRLRELAVETFRRKRAQGMDFPKPAGPDYYRALQERVVGDGLGRLYLARREDREIAGAFFVRFGPQAYYLLSAADGEGLASAAPDLLLWTAIQDFQAEGCRLFNFGGLSEAELEGRPLAESGLYHFKQRFSAEPRPCWKGTAELRPLTLRALSWARALRAWAGRA